MIQKNFIKNHKITKVLKIWKIILSIFLIFICFNLICFAGIIKTIAILDLKVIGGKTDTLSNLISNILIYDLSQENKISVVDRKIIEEVLKEQKFSKSGFVDSEHSTEIGKILGVNYVITGSATFIEEKVRIDIQLINVETTEIIPFTSTGYDENIIHEITEKIVLKLSGTNLNLKKEDPQTLLIIEETTKSDGNLTIVIEMATENTINGVIKQGGGVSTYKWTIYPDKYIQKEFELVEEVERKSRDLGLSTVGTSVFDIIYQIKGNDFKTKNEIKNTLKEGKPVCCILNGPNMYSFDLPSGKYYIDYSVELRHNTSMGWGNLFAPMSHGTREDWGPYEIIIEPGKYQKIICQPDLDNCTPSSDDTLEFMRFISTGSRR